EGLAGDSDLAEKGVGDSARIGQAGLQGQVAFTVDLDADQIARAQRIVGFAGLGPGQVGQKGQGPNNSKQCLFHGSTYSLSINPPLVRRDRLAPRSPNGSGIADARGHPYKLIRSDSPATSLE